MIVERDSTSFRLCSDYTLRKPSSLPVQLEFGRIQELKVWQRSVLLLGIILHFREVSWLSHC